MMYATLMVTWLDTKIYFITFYQWPRLYTLVYLIRNKSDTLDNFKVFVPEIKNQFNKEIKWFCSDGGTNIIPTLQWVL